MARAESIRVAVGCSPCAGEAVEVSLDLPLGSTLLDAARASGLLERYPGIDISSLAVGIWGRIRTLDTLVGEGDRIEIYRPLLIDPKQARRLRAQGHATR